VDLALTDEDGIFAAEVREWVAGFVADHLTPRPTFSSLDEEFEWGRALQAQMAADRWVGIHWPSEFGGRDATPLQVAIYLTETARAQIPQPVNRVGINLVGPTLLVHGTVEQCSRWLRRILDASEIWCQLFSEPDAGSDLASLTTRAEPVEGGYLLSGTKVWTSYAQFADWGLCLARTSETSGSRSLSMLAVDMHADGVEVRPLVQMTGDAEFSQVFLENVFVPSSCRIGEEGSGWNVASSTLSHERGANFPVKEQAVHEAYFLRLFGQADKQGCLDDPLVARALAESYVKLRILRCHNLRTLTRLSRSPDPGPHSSWVKLAWTELTQQLSDTAMVVSGRSPASSLAGAWSRQWLWSRAASIAGGTSEIQREIIATRLLGLGR